MIEGCGQQQKHFEEVSIENVHVGDYLSARSAGPARTSAHCVLSKAPMRIPPSQRVVGWHVEVAQLGVLWLPRQSTVKRRRFECLRNEPAALARMQSR